MDAEMSAKVGLCAEGVADAGDRIRVCGLDAGHHVLDVVTILCFAARMTGASAAGFFNDWKGRVV